MAEISTARRSGPKPHTLAIDIGGTGLKALVLDAKGTPLTERARIPTPHPATPRAVLRDLAKIVTLLGDFDRVSVGFPGVVIEGTIKTAPNLHRTWAGFPLAATLKRTLKRPVRVLNDAGVQGHGVIEGRGLEMVLTLGTGLGCALFIDGRYVPNLELAHHPYRKGRTYEDELGNAAYEKHGKKKWNKRVARALGVIDPIWNPRKIYIGGGNAKHLTIALPKHVKMTQNVAGLLGGIALWHDEPAPTKEKRVAAQIERRKTNGAVVP
jgi:polyphosphate glucokinase